MLALPVPSGSPGFGRSLAPLSWALSLVPVAFVGAAVAGSATAAPAPSASSVMGRDRFMPVQLSRGALVGKLESGWRLGGEHPAREPTRAGRSIGSGARPLALPPPPPAHLRRRGRPGARRPHAAQRRAVRQGAPRLSLRRLAGDGQDLDAKILAACLNCERGPTIEPDGTCESCRAIAEARSLDVIEMDAASNNSVDDIRDLRDRVGYAPVSGRSKVYILDEAHMLSPQAWNAFLKTLEEPPPDTIFVLATTEAQKVLPTVVDRCHRFDFAR